MRQVREAILRGAAADEQDVQQVEVVPPPLVVNNPDDLTRVIVSPDRWAVVRQGDPDGAPEALVARLRAGTEEFRQQGLARFGVRSRWILPYEAGGWDELLGQYRRAFLSGGPHSEYGADATIVFDPSPDVSPDARVQSGPMRREQLETFLLFPEELPDVPELLLFADVDWRVMNAGNIEFRTLEQHIRSGVRYASEVADTLGARFAEAG